MELCAFALAFAGFDLLICFICLLCSRTWRQVLVSLAFMASLIGCLWLCTLVNTAIGMIICDSLYAIGFSFWGPYLDEYVRQQDKARENQATE
jgi:hypothetical protein